MANFSQFFSDESDLYNELTNRTPTPLTNGQLLQIDSTKAQIVGYDLISGVANTEIVTETTETAALDLSAAPSFGASGTDASSTITYTSTASEVLTDAFSAGDLVYFSGTFSDSGNAINATGTSQGYTPEEAFGTGDYLFAFPIASISGSSGTWTIVLNLNVPPFTAWQEGSTDALVNAHSTMGANYPSSDQTEIFFATAVVTGNLDVTLRTTTTTSSVEISQYADGDLEIAGINGDGVVINLTQGDFGTAGQAVLVNSTGDGLTFGNAGIDLSTSTAGRVQLVNTAKDGFVDSVINQPANSSIHITNGLRVDGGMAAGFRDMIFQIDDGNEGSFRVQDTNGNFMLEISDTPEVVIGRPTTYDLPLTVHGDVTIGGTADSRDFTVVGLGNTDNTTPIKPLGVTHEGLVVNTGVPAQTASNVDNENDEAGASATVGLWSGTQAQYNALWSNGDGTGTFNGNAGTFYIIN